MSDLDDSLNNLKINNNNSENVAVSVEETLETSTERGRPVKSKRANSFVGTAQFVAPEILKSKSVHKGSDLWSLGCIVHQLITGKHLFHGR